jgi:hypothetical protein
MAGWRRAVELAMTGEEIETLTALSRSRKVMRDWLELMLRRTGELVQRLQHVTPTPTLPVAVRLYVQHELIRRLV